MIDIERGQELHDRYTTGSVLTVGERADLDAWYAQMDADEAAINVRARAESVATDEILAELSQLRQELRKSLEGLLAITERNEQLRRENEELRRRIVDRGALAA